MDTITLLLIGLAFIVGIAAGYIYAQAQKADERQDLFDELWALRELRETCGMYCEQLPVEVREALHAVPDVEKTHGYGK
jgi:hypothetical protein